jgi:hypothetical protein
MKGPQKVSDYWRALPTRIDAVYRVPEIPGVDWASGHLRFFSGAQYWEFNGPDLLAGFPKRLTELGLPSGLYFNAAVNRRKGKGDNFRRWTHLFARRKYYVFDEKLKRLISRQGFPYRRLHIFSPYGKRMQGAIGGNADGKTYFFYDEIYYAQDDESQGTFIGNIYDDFFHCCKENQGRVEFGVMTVRGNGRCQPETNDYDGSYDDYGGSDQALTDYNGSFRPSGAKLQAKRSPVCPLHPKKGESRVAQRRRKAICKKMFSDPFVQHHPGNPVAINRAGQLSRRRDPYDAYQNYH